MILCSCDDPHRSNHDDVQILRFHHLVKSCPFLLSTPELCITMKKAKNTTNKMNRNSQTSNHSNQQSSQCKKKPGCRQLVSLSPFPQPLLFFGLSERFFFREASNGNLIKAQGRELISCCCNKDCWSSLIPYIFKLLFILPLFLLYTILIIFLPALSLFRNLQHCRWEVNQQRPTDLLLRDQLPKTTQT